MAECYDEIGFTIKVIVGNPGTFIVDFNVAPNVCKASAQCAFDVEFGTKQQIDIAFSQPSDWRPSL